MAQNDSGAPSADDVRRDLIDLLLEKIDRDPYPSVTMMDLVEELIGPDERGAYAAVLMDKIRSDNLPSLDMMSRVRDLT